MNLAFYKIKYTFKYKLIKIILYDKTKLNTFSKNDFISISKKILYKNTKVSNFMLKYVFK